jgi:hypothetical protein
MSAEGTSLRPSGDRSELGRRQRRGGSGAGSRESGDLRVVETTLLLLAALLLAIATVNDVVRQAHVNHRLIADLATWRSYTGHRYHNLSISQDYSEHFTREVVCGNTSPGEPKQRVQLCLVMNGPVAGGRRRVSGGWYLPARVEDEPRYRYGCFGSAPAEFGCQR